MGRLVGYLGQLDVALGAAREAGVKFDFAPIDEIGLFEKLERAMMSYVVNSPAAPE